MYFDLGSSLNNEEPFELEMEDNGDQDFDQEFVVELDPNPPSGVDDIEDMPSRLPNSSHICDISNLPDDSSSEFQSSPNDSTQSLPLKDQPDVFESYNMQCHFSTSSSTQTNFEDLNYQNHETQAGEVPQDFAGQKSFYDHNLALMMQSHINFNGNTTVTSGENGPTFDQIFISPQCFSSVYAAQDISAGFNKTNHSSNLSLKAKRGWGSKASHACQSSACEEFDKFLAQMVLQNQTKIGKKLKVIIFNFFREYLMPSHPELAKHLRPLSRDELRKSSLVSQRLYRLKDYIYYSFTYQNKETLVPIVERYFELVLKYHKRKGVKNAKSNLKQIHSIKTI